VQAQLPSAVRWLSTPSLSGRGVCGGARLARNPAGLFPAMTSSRTPISPRPAASLSALRPAECGRGSPSSGRDGAGSTAMTSSRTWPAVMSAARIASCPSGRTSWSVTRSGSLRTPLSRWPLWSGGRSLVLRGRIPMGNTAPPYDFTWAFVLEDGPEGTTRLLVRERYANTRPWARLLVEPVEAVSFVMSHRMLRGIRNRAEHAAGIPLRSQAPARGSPKSLAR
jgi:hypothetical protein